MKFMQIHTFYPAYLGSYYGKNPAVAGFGYEEQIAALMADGFSGSHLFAPYLRELGYHSMLVIANCEQTQRRWLAEHAPQLAQSSELGIHEVALMQVERFRPDVLYLSDPIVFDSRFVRALSYRPAMVFGWRAAQVPAQTDWSDFDLIVSNFNFALELALKHGAKGREFFMPGFPSQLAAAVAGEEKKWDLVFTGQLSAEHAGRRALLNEVSKQLLLDDRPFSPAYFIPGDTSELEAGIAMHNKGPVWGLDMFRTLRQGRISLNAQIDMGNEQAGNMRLFETTGVGTFLLTDHHDNIGRYFKPGEEVESYRSTGELMEKIHHYLRHPEEREAIARRGQRRCLNYYSMEKMARVLDGIVRRGLAAKGRPSRAGRDPLPAAPPELSAPERELEELLQALRPHTKLESAALDSLLVLARTVCEQDLPGNFVECADQAGGSAALLAWAIAKYSKRPRQVLTFTPASSAAPTVASGRPGSRAWQEICARFGISAGITVAEGCLESLPCMRDWAGMIALLHVSSIAPDSARAALESLYDRVVHRGAVLANGIGGGDGCEWVLTGFESERGLRFAVIRVEGGGACFVKEQTFPLNAEIDHGLVQEFQLDDPVAKGIASQMSANERFQLYFALRREVPQSQGVTRFLEIGSYSGASLVLSHQALRRTGLPFQGICIEPGGTEQFHEVVKILKDNVVHLPMFSHQAVQRLQPMLDGDRRPRIIFVDGDHSYEGVRRDIVDFYPLLRPGGLMVFHDYLPELDDGNRAFILHHHAGREPGVRRACQELMEGAYGCSPVDLPLLYPSDPTQTQPQLPVIPGVFSTVRAYRKPAG